MSRQDRAIKVIGTIDMTPLMDMMFMLLVVFIITVPSLNYTTEVNPPDMNTPTSVEEIENKAILTLSSEGIVELDGRVVGMSSLVETLREVGELRPGVSLLIVADGKRPYEDVISLHRSASLAQIKNIHLVTQAVTGE
ncbi:MAG: biopolymer transporter ExbD [Lentisphaerae bacterium]|jgi:biopolymer transport protein TolR|nr:biopolymer transporter ExbD [Lentisphaerota bacterium]